MANNYLTGGIKDLDTTELSEENLTVFVKQVLELPEFFGILLKHKLVTLTRPRVKAYYRTKLALMSRNERAFELLFNNYNLSHERQDSLAPQNQKGNSDSEKPITKHSERVLDQTDYNKYFLTRRDFISLITEIISKHYEFQILKDHDEHRVKFIIMVIELVFYKLDHDDDDKIFSKEFADGHFVEEIEKLDDYQNMENVNLRFLF